MIRSTECIWRWLSALIFSSILLGAATPAAGQQPEEDKKQELPPTELLTQRRLNPDLGKKEQMQLPIAEVEDLRGYLGLAAATRFQALFQDDVFVTDTEQMPPSTRELDEDFVGFQTPWGNLRVLTSYKDLVQVYFDLYIASRPHPSTTYGHEGFVLIRGLPDEVPLKGVFDYLNLKAGSFEIAYGDQIYRRSDNGDVQRNPLVGNYIVDMHTTEIGLELFGTGETVNWLAGVTNGTTTGSFDEGHGTALHGKFWAYPVDQLRLALSGYWVDHSDNGTGFPGGGTKSYLFAGNRSGGPYAAILGGGDSPGQVLPGRGQRVAAGQLDLTAEAGPLELYAHGGYTQDTDTNGDADGEPASRWEYHAAEVVLNLTDRLYLAGRYTGAIALEIDDQDASGMVNRGQLGLGYWLTERLLVKSEGVYQTYSDFDEPNGTVSGVNAWRDPQFYGGLVEGSYQF